MQIGAPQDVGACVALVHCGEGLASRLHQLEQQIGIELVAVVLPTRCAVLADDWQPQRANRHASCRRAECQGQGAARPVQRCSSPSVRIRTVVVERERQGVKTRSRCDSCTWTGTYESERNHSVGVSARRCVMLSLSALVVGLSSSPYLRAFHGCKGGTLEGCPSVRNTTKNWRTQNVDHFDWSTPLGGKMTYQQRCACTPARINQQARTSTCQHMFARS